MYARSYGLRTSPYNMTPDPAFLYVTPQYREALVALAYAVLGRKGFVVLTGEAGIGKTTLLVKILKSVPVSRLQFSVIVNPTLTPSEFLELVLLDFGVRDIPASKAQRLWKLQDLLFSGRNQGRISALIVDEAHKLSHEVLEEIRLLGNFEETQRKLLQIVLVGQDELDEILNRDDLRQLKQRIALRMALHPLEPAEVAQYIQHRWRVAGGEDAPFTREAVMLIAAASRGIPRLINSVCENSLMLSFAEGCPAVEMRHVEGAVADLQLVTAPHHLLPALDFPPRLTEDAKWVDEAFSEVLANILEESSPDPRPRRVQVLPNRGDPAPDSASVGSFARAADVHTSPLPGPPEAAVLPAEDRYAATADLQNAEDPRSSGIESGAADPRDVQLDRLVPREDPEPGVGGPDAAQESIPEHRNGAADPPESALRGLGFFTLARYGRRAKRNPPPKSGQTT